MNKKIKQFIHHGIILLLILVTLLTGCGRAEHSVSTVSPTEDQIHGGSMSTTEDALTTDVATTTEATEEEVVPDAKPENILCVEEPEDRLTYLRSMLMALLSVPDQLGDSCYIKLDNIAVQILSTEKIDSGTIHEYEALSTAYYVKDSVLYRNEMSMQTWHELLNDKQELKYLYNPYGSWVKIELLGEKLLNEEELKEIYEKKCNCFVTISGTLSQELYPLGQDAGIEKPYWGGKMVPVGLWYTKLTGECYGEIAGDIYVMEPNEKYSAGSYWICFDGMEPIKIPRMEGMTYHLTEAPVAVEGADFAKEKENALYKLSFDLLVEPAEDVE